MQYLRQTSPLALAELGKQHHAAYAAAQPYPHAVFDGVFSPEALRAIIAEFPDLRSNTDQLFDTPNEVKRATLGEHRFGPQMRGLMHFLNSQPFLEFLEALTGITGLLPDPYFVGGGCHETLPGGFLKIHADFNKQPRTNLDRRLNVLIYLNEDWDDAYGGHFEMWDAQMNGCVKKVSPAFNRMVVFTTTDSSFHGHPEPLTCPPGRSRRSLALYYYTNGRPEEEQTAAGSEHSTVFVYRKSLDQAAREYSKQIFRDRTLRGITRELVPPALMNTFRKLAGRPLS